MTGAKANINIKVDADVKEKATRLLGRMGLDQTRAIDMFLRQIIAERRLPFQPVVALTTEEQIIAALEQRLVKEYTLDVSEDGALIIDKELHGDLYDWAVNG